MTTSWNVTRDSKPYRDALLATQDITSDKKPKGFVHPEAEGAEKVTAIIKQNNFLIQAVITQSRQIEELAQSLQQLRSEVQAATRSQRPEVALPDDVISDLTEKFKGLKADKKQPKTTPFYKVPNPFTKGKEVKEG